MTGGNDEGDGSKAVLVGDSSTHSHYYINPNENLAQGIINVKLDGTNYHLWSRSMRIALKTKKKLGFINGELPMPGEDDPEFDAWEQCNTTVVAWIINSLDREISEVVIDNDSALELWKELQEKYGEADSVRIAQLRAEISTCRQGNSTVTEYYNRLKNLWSEYVSFRPIPACECGGVKHIGTCNTYTAVKNYQENDHVIDFIIGLNEEHENTKSQLLLMDPPPSLKVASKFAMKLERQIKGINKEVKTVDTVALAGTQTGDWNRDRVHKPNSSNTIGQAQGQGQGLFCRYCKKTNHNIEDCLRLKHKRKMERSGNTGGYYRAANSAYCPSQQQQNEGLPNQDNSSDQNATLRLSSEDCNRLMAILQQNSSTASSSANTPQANLTRTNTTSVYPNFAGPSHSDDDWFCKRS